LNHPFQPHTAHSPCSICAATQGFLLTRFDNFFRPQITHLCAICGTAYTDPLPSPQAFAEYHRAAYRKQYKGQPEAPFRLQRIQKVNQNRFEFLKQQLPLPHTGYYLDIGCGYGYLVETFARIGWTARGFDPDPRVIAHAQTRLQSTSTQAHIETGTFHTTHHTPESYQLITAFHVLEHLPNPLDALLSCHRWLIPGGHLLIEVPNLITHAHSFHSRFHRAHVVHFYEPTLSHTLEKLGFKNIRSIFSQTSPAIRILAQKPDTPLTAPPTSQPINTPFPPIDPVLAHLTHIYRTRRFTSRTLRQWLETLHTALQRLRKQ
jgi:2-polyprenyl-3-methyl-5-hydroxy-6-metoxy-1,4-benzoquinol methylase